VFGRLKQVNRSILVIGTVWAIGTLAIAALWPAHSPASLDEVVVVTHWANPYLMRDDTLPSFAAQFNAAGNRIRSGKRIEVRPYSVNSGTVMRELVSLARTGHISGTCQIGVAACPRDLLLEPVVVTPAAAHWLSLINLEAGMQVVDASGEKIIALSYTGIVTHREMARCLGWPERDIGIADIVALRENPAGWESLPCAKAEWGRTPLTVFTDPQTSSTGRSMLYALYSIGVGKASNELTIQHVNDPGVMGYVKRFQAAVDHYGPDAGSVGDQFICNPRYGHFFFLPENQLYLIRTNRTFGTASCARTEAPPDIVMIYPREGATAQRLPAALVRTRWVSEEQTEAARRWIDFLLEAPQQKMFLQHGLRPTASIPITEVIHPRNGLDPTRPLTAVNPEVIDPIVARQIGRSWGDVKNSGVLSFVLDASVTSAGPQPSPAQAGLIRALDAMNNRNLVGAITFSREVVTRVEVAPVSENRFKVSEAVIGTRPGVGSVLYDAIHEAVRMTDAAPAEVNAIRGVVVLAGIEPTAGRSLEDLIELVTRDGKAVRECRGFVEGTYCVDESDRTLSVHNLVGTDLRTPTRHPIKIFFVQAGDRVDPQIGCLLAEATRTDISCTAAGDVADHLTRVLAQYGDYF
jgi:hypothetical protein